MKKLIYLLLLLLYGYTAKAGFVAANTAKYVAAQHFNANGIAADTTDLSTYATKTIIVAGKPTPVYYVFNYKTNGFILISATDDVPPVLAWSSEAVFDSTNLPPNSVFWFNNLYTQLAYRLGKQLPATQAAMAQWQQLLHGSTGNFADKTNGSSPLIKTQWNQNGYYNALCPKDPVSAKKALTGCVATVLAQLMRYWSFPAKGIGFHAYSSNTFGVLSADFGRTKYGWASMPNALYSNNNQVATIMYQAGVALDMDYGISSSSSYVLAADCPIRNNAQFALVNYFCYQPTIRGLYRQDYNNTNWLALIQNEINALRPVIYNGANDTEGHSFIADGYDNYNNIHFNWGWGGAFNGYYSIDSLVPDSINLMKGNTVLVGIQPDSARMLVMDDSTAPTATIYQKAPFALTTKVINVNTQPFTGSVTALLISDYYPDYQATQVIDNQTIAWGDSASLSFQFNDMLPGSYHVKLLYQPANKDTESVCNTAEYNNNTPITIFGAADLHNFTVFPNPAADYVYINLNNANATAYRILDLNGRTILTGNIEQGQAVIPIPVIAIQSGLYIVQLNTPTNIETEKVIIAR